MRTQLIQRPRRSCVSDGHTCAECEAGCKNTTLGASMRPESFALSAVIGIVRASCSYHGARLKSRHPQPARIARDPGHGSQRGSQGRLSRLLPEQGGEAGGPQAPALHRGRGSAVHRESLILAPTCPHAKWYSPTPYTACQRAPQVVHVALR